MSRTIGHRVRIARERRGLTVNALDRACGSKSGYISRLEGGAFATVGSDKLAALARALDVSIDWIVLGTGRFEARLRDRPDWGALVEAGRRRYSTIDDRAWAAVGALHSEDLPARIDLALVAALARAIQDAREAEATAEQDYDAIPVDIDSRRH